MLGLALLLLVVGGLDSSGGRRSRPRTRARSAARPRPAGPTGCAATVAGVTGVVTEMAAVGPGAVVCVRPGSYGPVVLARSRPGDNAVLAPLPDLDPNAAGRVQFSGITIAGSDVTVRDVYSTGGISVTGTAGGYHHDVITHDDVSNAHGFGISVLAPFTRVASDITISGNHIHDTCSTCEGDALRLDGWRDITISGNEIDAIRECPAGDCHTDTLQSYQANSATSGLTVTRNYVHDTVDAQGLPFLKDGDIQQVSITDNLSVRMASTGQTNGPGIDENTRGLIIAGNTYVNAGGYLEAGGTAAGSSAEVNGNVFNSFNVQPPAYRLTEDHNLYTGNNQWSFRIGAHSLAQSAPRYLCGARCGDGTPAGDDYRLVGYRDPRSPDDGIGIDWNPADQRYGPVIER